MVLINTYFRISYFTIYRDFSNFTRIIKTGKITICIFCFLEHTAKSDSSFINILLDFVAKSSILSY